MTCKELAAKLLETPDLLACAVDFEQSEEYEIEKTTVEAVTLWDGNNHIVCTAVVLR